MIAMNPLRQKVLITTDEVIFHGPVENNPDIRSLLQSIIIAETRFIIPLIGSTAYKKLVDAKNTLVTDANKAQLTTNINAARAPKREAIVLNEGDYVNSDSYLNDVQKDLWRNYLHKITAECVVFVALPVNRARFTGKGVVKNFPNSIGNSGDSASVDLYELKHLMDRTLWNRIGPLMEQMHQHMCTTSYPDYDKRSHVPAKPSSISLSMYDDDDDKCRCNWP